MLEVLTKSVTRSCVPFSAAIAASKRGSLRITAQLPNAKEFAIVPAVRLAVELSRERVH